MFLGDIDIVNGYQSSWPIVEGYVFAWVPPSFKVTPPRYAKCVQEKHLAYIFL